MTNFNVLFKEIKKIKGCIVRKNEPLSKYTTLRIGGPCEILVIPGNVDALKELIKLTSGIKKSVIGNGSDLILPDSGINSIVIRMCGSINDLSCDGRRVVAGAGSLMQSLIRKTSGLGLSGLEFASGVPASLGGAIVTNMGAFKSEMGSFIEYIEVIDSSGRTIKLNRSELDFSYRKSNIKDCIVVSACLKLKHMKRDKITKKINECLAWRKEYQPISVPSAGSVFKNPKDVPAGKLIDMAGLKGLRVGGAEISKKHANFIINLGDAKGSDVRTLITKVRRIVKEKFKVRLETELIDRHELTMLS